ncbi:MAG: hypothetical protein HOV81_11015 [Kofleriaceae bacterium]|nr:hypothetical protein [Kofleriaceae bacterium]
MRRFAPLLVVAACSGSTDDTRAVEHRTAKILSSTYDAVLTAKHGGSIEAIAVSDDGTAVLTQDAFGGTRLWPTLDGHHEPIVVAMPEAVDLAIAHDMLGFTLAARDTVGGLEIVRIAYEGRVMSRARIAAEPAIEQLAIAEQGVIVSRADQTLAIYDDAGGERAHLAPPPGSRVKSIVARHDRVLVILERDGSFYGRWLAGTAWGSETQTLPLDASPFAGVVLSPSGDKLAVGYGGYVSIVDPNARTPELVGLSNDTGRVYGAPLGFLDANTLVVSNPSRQMELVTLDGRRKPMTPNAGVIAIGNDIAVSAAKDSLELTTAEHTRYLGYSVGALKRVAFHDEAYAIADKESQPRVLDGSLAVGEPLTLPGDPRELADATRLPDGNVLALHKLGGWYTVSILDPRTSQTVQALNQVSRYWQLSYEPTTELLVLADASTVFLVERDRKTGKFDTWYRVDADPDRATVYLTDPQKAGGAIAMIATTMSSYGSYTSPIVEVIERKDLVVGETIKGRRVLEAAVHVPLVTREGHVFSIADPDVVEYVGKRVVARYAGANLGRLVPSPDGRYLAAHGESRIRLYKRGGALVWEIAAPLVNDLGWIDGNLVGVFGGGLAKLDLETGAFDRRACGWSFGLGTFPPHDPSESESVCDAR